MSSPVAVVTGAARGIGAAVAHALATDGWHLALGDICANDPGLHYPLATTDDLHTVADACRAEGVEVVARQCDVRSQVDVDALVADAATLGPVHAAVAVAGVLGGHGPAWQLDDDTLQRDLGVNYKGVVTLTRAAVPHLLAAGSLGRFVAVVSTAGVTGLPRLASYSAANAVLPGSTDTALLHATAAAYDLPDPTAFARHARAGRLLRPAEVAAAVQWLCMPRASGTTGAALPVDAAFTG